MITVRDPGEIYQAKGEIEDGTFRGRWHFSFGDYHDPENAGFGTLRVFNDDTLSPGATWPLHPHRDIEVVTYCAEGEFRHADERGKGGVLKKGWVQHTAVGSGMWHSEINNRTDAPMRFIQMWFYPSERGLPPSVEQRPSSNGGRHNSLELLVAPADTGALHINSDAKVLSADVDRGNTVEYGMEKGRGAYLYVIKGGPVDVNGKRVDALGAARAIDESVLRIDAVGDAELLLVDVGLH